MRSVGAIAACLLVLTGCRSPYHTPAVSSDAVAQARAAGAKEITYVTPDGITIHGDYLDAGGDKAVILLHQWARDGRTWTPYLKAFKDAGISALAIDARGNGRSAPQGGQEIAPTWDLTMDIQGAVDFLQGKAIVREGGKEVARSAMHKAIQIGIAGASYGANNALIYAADHPFINAVALLSPGKDYHGLVIAGALAKYKGVAFMMTSKGDSVQDGGPDVVRQAMGKRVRVVEFSGDKHGTDMLDAHPAAAKELAKFFATATGGNK